MPEVANLTAPITIKIPFKQIAEFKAKLEQMADILELIVVKFRQIDKVSSKAMKDTSKGIKVVHNDNRKIITDNRKIIRQSKEKGKLAKKANKESEKTSSKATKTSAALGSVTAKIAQLRVAIGLFKFVADLLAKIIAVPIGIFTGLLLLGKRINRITAEMVLLARATGNNVNNLRALELAAKDLGFTFEHVNSLTEELTNKMGGELAGAAENNLREGFASLNIELERMKKLNPDDQLKRIMEAGKALAEKGKIQEVSSSYDKIFGQEGNRLLTSFTKKMIKNNQTWDEFIKSYDKFTHLNQEVQDGAIAFTQIWNKGMSAMTSSMARFFGGVGAKLQPFQKDIENLFAGLFGGMNDTSELMQNLFVEAIFEVIKLLSGLKLWFLQNEQTVRAWGRMALSIFKDIIFLLAVTLRNLVPVVTAMLLLSQILLKINTIMLRNLPFLDDLSNAVVVLHSIRSIIIDIMEIWIGQDTEKFFERMLKVKDAFGELANFVGNIDNKFLKLKKTSTDVAKAIMTIVRAITAVGDVDLGGTIKKAAKGVGFGLGIPSIGNLIGFGSDDKENQIKRRSIIGERNDVSNTNSTVHGKSNSDNSTINNNTFNLSGDEAVDAVREQIPDAAI